jgi:AhpD family alkylhydroperoxidase
VNGPHGPTLREIPMSSRLSYRANAEALQPLYALNAYVRSSGLEPSLIELVQMRVSQLNGCAYCLDMHSKDGRAGGESEQRLYLLQAWREAPLFSDREGAALAWCEAVTRLGEHGVPDAVYEQARAQFSEKELGDLNMAVILINAWNRIAIPFQTKAGGYRPPSH